MNTINEFNYDMVKKYPVMVNLGRRRVGKSVLTKDQVYNYHVKRARTPFIILVSPTGVFNTDYDYLEPKYKFDAFTEPLLEGLLLRQRKLIETEPKGDYDTLLILDDIVKSGNKRQIDLLSRLLTLSRHYRLSIILNIQYLKSSEFSPTMRDNVDYMFIFKQNNYDNKKNIVEQWLSLKKDSKHLGYEIIEDIPQDYRVMVIDNTLITNDYTDFVFHYTADIETIPKNFKIIPKNMNY